MSQARALTTTSYAVLSVLAIREHSTYELVEQLRLSLHYLWPRAESNVYAEPKRLLQAGLVQARAEWTGDRRRTVYSITDNGRSALAEWLSEESSRQRYESEAVLKVFFAENGTRGDLLRSIRALRDESLATVEHFQRASEPYADGTGRHPHRFALSALVARLLSEQQAVTARWAEWAEQVVSGWSSASEDDPAWGVEVVHEAGEPFPLDHDPVREVVERHRRAAPS